MAFTLFKLLPMVVLAQAAIYCGVFFSSGQLWPSVFGGIYASTGVLMRTAAALILFFSVGNYLLAWAYLKFDPGLVTPLSIFFAVTLQIALTILILNVKPSPLLIPAVLLTAAGCVWVGFLLKK